MFLLDVKPEHISKGQKDSSLNCPVAIALQEAILVYSASHGLPEVPTVRVSEYGVYLGYGQIAPGMHRLEIPMEVSVFVYNFDNGYPVEPFQVELNWDLSFLEETDD